MLAYNTKRFLMNQSQKLFTRQLSIRAGYSSLPATLHHYRQSLKPILYNIKERDSRPYDLFENGVVLSDDGLVYPLQTRTPDSPSNGAALYPNTFNFQEIARQYFDDVLDREEEGIEVERPSILTIPKGTLIPFSLILTNIATAHFSLQPSHGMPLKDLNSRLDDFFSQYAINEKADDWFDGHPYSDAIPDDQEARWMAH